MPRSKNKAASHRRRKAILKQAKGYVGARSKLYTVAKNAVEKGLSHSYRDRKLKKRVYRNLWIVRINAAARISGTTKNLDSVSDIRAIMSQFGRGEKARLSELLDAAADAVEAWARDGTNKAANHFNAFELRPDDEARSAPPGAVDGPPGSDGIRRTRTGWRKARPPEEP